MGVLVKKSQKRNFAESLKTNQNKKFVKIFFGEFEYFGGSDVVNKLKAEKKMSYVPKFFFQ